MRTMLISSLLILGLVACGGKAKPAPPEPTATEPTPTDRAAACNLEGPDQTPATMEQCQCMGMEAVGDIGNGQVACPEGHVEVSKIRFGIEGGVCCANREPGPEAS